jgi:hypothetical protein
MTPAGGLVRGCVHSVRIVRAYMVVDALAGGVV